jgi:hypothetical protein
MQKELVVVGNLLLFKISSQLENFITLHCFAIPYLETVNTFNYSLSLNSFKHDTIFSYFFNDE